MAYIRLRQLELLVAARLEKIAALLRKDDGEVTAAQAIKGIDCLQAQLAEIRRALVQASK